MTILNERAVNQLTRLQDRIRQSAGSENSPNAMTEEWKQTGVDTLIQTLRDNLQTTKDAKLTKLHEQLAEAEALPDSEKHGHCRNGCANASRRRRTAPICP